jgi:hypothetical protein
LSENDREIESERERDRGGKDERAREREREKERERERERDGKRENESEGERERERERDREVEREEFTIQIVFEVRFCQETLAFTTRVELETQVHSGKASVSYSRPLRIGQPARGQLRLHFECS